MEKKQLSVIVPCFNEELVIGETNTRVMALLTGFLEKKLITDFEILYVNDGSSDATLEMLRGLASKEKRIKVISLSGNFGHQAALTAGLYNCSGDFAVSLDADLQDPPEVIEAMIERYNSGYDIVYGVRSNRQQDSLFKRFTAQFFYRLMAFMGVDIVYNHADFRLISRAVISEFKKYGETNRFLRGIFPSMGFRQGVVEYAREKRFAGTTKYPLGKMLMFAVEGITSFSNFPLRLSFLLGFINFMAALILVIWTLVTKFKGAAIPGWASTVLPLYLFGGIQLMFIGILSEYVGKIYMEVKRRPLFIIKETYNLSNAKKTFTRRHNVQQNKGV
ncbi:glycosyltransferase [Candidatus Magnetobacterium bavaricum]|uniref:Glycosyltransferase n=1 Tax=Candidatus Magnetobacterium bavaricum TaxID=29290 RepID=A0A0F3GRK9_9BACT|nr:glycosyltransferase [Candidatus Magnetobacterium bavaricum]